MAEAAEDVHRALTILFRGTDALNRLDLERMLSFDMEWVGPSEAEQVVDALVAQGWLNEKEGLVHLAVTLSQISVPFGWIPRPLRLVQPVPAQAAPVQAVHQASPPTFPSVTSVARPSLPTVSGDPRAKLTQRLIRFIARQSGLETDELTRRAERKMSTFQLVTPWLAYALVAREQGLDMDGIVEALAVV